MDAGTDTAPHVPIPVPRGGANGASKLRTRQPAKGSSGRCRPVAPDIPCGAWTPKRAGVPRRFGQSPGNSFRPWARSRCAIQSGSSIYRDSYGAGAGMRPLMPNLGMRATLRTPCPRHVTPGIHTYGSRESIARPTSGGSARGRRASCWSARWHQSPVGGHRQVAPAP